MTSHDSMSVKGGVEGAVANVEPVVLKLRLCGVVLKSDDIIHPETVPVVLVVV